MPLEWLLVVLLVVFALGWFAARLDIRHVKSSAAELPRAYLRGLTELLNGSEEKALDSFSNIAPVDTLPSELQFAVGELSRRRGDYRRALKIHQQLQTDERLPSSDRNRALWELAKDCAAMGLVDTAEQYAQLLANIPQYRDELFNFLLENYQLRRRYKDALALIENADSDVRQLQQKTAAHLYCQLALADNTDNDAANALLEKALELFPSCARARLQLAQNALSESESAGNAVRALEYYAALAADTPEYLWLAAHNLMQVYSQMNDIDGGRKKLMQWLDDYPSPLLFIETLKIIEQQLSAAAESDNDDLKQRLRDYRQTIIDKFLITAGNLDAAAFYIEQHAAADNTPHWIAVKKILLNACRKALICDNCSYEMNHFSWQCPCCLRWESFRQQ